MYKPNNALTSREEKHDVGDRGGGNEENYDDFGNSDGMHNCAASGVYKPYNMSGGGELLLRRSMW